jgi:hypothetical protein
MNHLLDGVDVGLVASESLNRFSGSDIPNLGCSIASTRYKQVGVGCKRDTVRSALTSQQAFEIAYLMTSPV